MRLLSVSLVLLMVCFSLSPARAGSVVERVKARGVVRCGSTGWPGLAKADSQGQWSGLYVDVCRAIAAAVLGSADRIEYHEYETPKQFDAVRNQTDDVYFLTGSEIKDQNLAGKVVAGPTVFVETHNVMVPSNSPAYHVSDLAGHSICFLIASLAERSLGAYFDRLQKSWLHLPFSEEEEMNDAYNVQRCHAIAGEMTTLASSRQESGVNRLSSRILPEPLSVFPKVAATGIDCREKLSMLLSQLYRTSNEKEEVKPSPSEVPFVN